MLTAAGPGAFRVTALAAGRDAVTFDAQTRAARRSWRARRRVGDGPLPRPAAGTALDRVERAGALRDPRRRGHGHRGDGGIVSLAPVLAALRAGKVVADREQRKTLVAGAIW
ncbi:MAG: hypothetical protein R3C32_15685 [Chloroflexota bacterium]